MTAGMEERRSRTCDDMSSHEGGVSGQQHRCTCPFCGRSFPSDDGDQPNTVQSTDRSLCLCMKCGYSWRSINKKPIRCPKCRSKAWYRPDTIYRCYMCDHEWIARKEDIPSRCPKCRSSRWNDPTAAKKRTVIAQPPPAGAVLY